MAAATRPRSSTGRHLLRPAFDADHTRIRAPLLPTSHNLISWTLGRGTVVRLFSTLPQACLQALPVHRETLLPKHQTSAPGLASFVPYYIVARILEREHFASYMLHLLP